MTKFQEFKLELAKITDVALLLVGSFYGYDDEGDSIDESWTDDDIPEKLKYTILEEPPLYEDAPAKWVYHFTYYDIIVEFSVNYYSSYYDSEWSKDVRVREVFPKHILETVYVSAEELGEPDKALEDYIANRRQESGYSTWM